MTLNNPLDLLSLKLLGIGVEVCVVTVDEKRTVDLTIETIVWSKKWQFPF